MTGVSTYAWLDQMRERMGADDSDTSDDGRYVQKLHSATRFIDQYTGRSFQPEFKSRLFDFESYRCLHLDPYSLLELQAVTCNNDAVLVPTTDILTVGTPGYLLETVPGAQLFDYENNTRQALSVSGRWGYHEDYANAWRRADEAGAYESSDVLPGDDGYNVTVIAISGMDEYGYAPRFQVGQLIRIEGWYSYIAGMNKLTNELIIRAGVNGTTKSLPFEEADPAVYVWWPELAVQEACLQVAAWMIRREDAGEGGEVGLPAAAGFSIKNEVPQSALDLLEPYVKVG